jgi:hypothetical protein
VTRVTQIELHSRQIVRTPMKTLTFLSNVDFVPKSAKIVNFDDISQYDLTTKWGTFRDKMADFKEIGVECEFCYAVFEGRSNEAWFTPVPVFYSTASILSCSRGCQTKCGSAQCDIKQSAKTQSPMSVRRTIR